LLCKYPNPIRCIYDQGGEYTAPEFQSLLVMRNITPVPITVKNPQANSICERIHHTMGDIIRTMVNDNEPTNVAQAWELVDLIIARVQHALRATVHRTYNISPGALVFHRDMSLLLPILADFEQLRQKRQALIDRNSARENLRCRFKDYEVGDEVMILTEPESKLGPQATGPYIVAQV
jgi:transposase InsO family protein